METLPVAQLASMAAPYNPRRISDHDLAALRRSIHFFGTVEPVVVNRRSDRIVGGHQRVKAAQAEGLETFPVVFVDLDDPSEKQLNLALNRISGDWDDAKLGELLRALEAEGADMALTAFTDKELEAMLASGPAFEPVDFTGERLDRTDPVRCPECGHTFAAYNHKVKDAEA